MQKKYKKPLLNSIWSSGSFISITTISLLTTPFIVNKLTIEGYGIYVLITSLIGYYGILDLGLGQALVKYVAEYVAVEDNKNLSEVINVSFVVQAVMGLLGSTILYFAAPYIVTLLKISSTFRDTAIFSIDLCTIGFFFTLLTSVFSSTLIGLQKFHINAKVDSSINLLLNIFLIILLYHGWGLKESIIVNVVFSMISFTIYFTLAKKNIPAWKFKIVFDFKRIKQIFNFSFYIFLSKVSNVVSTYLVRFLISFMLGPSAVTYFAVSSKIVNAFAGILGSAANSLFPYASQLSAEKNDKELKQTFVKGSAIFAGIVIPVTLFMFLFPKQILSVWMGTDFSDKAWFVLGITSLGSMVGAFSAIPNLIMMGIGNSKLVGKIAFVTIVLYFIFLPVFTYLWQINGTAIGMLATSFFVILFVLQQSTKRLDISLKYYVKEVFSPHYFILVLAMLLFFINLIRLEINSYLVLAIGGTIVLGYYLYLIKIDVLPTKLVLAKRS